MLKQEQKEEILNASSTDTDTTDKIDYSKNFKVVEHIELPDSPFRVITVLNNDVKKSFGALGNKRITEFYKGENQVEMVKDYLDIKNITWDKISLLVVNYTNSVDEIKKLLNSL